MDYKSDVKLFKFRNYMGINPYEFSRGSDFHYEIDGINLVKGLFYIILFLFFI